MTALEAIAIREAEAQLRRARVAHERQALVEDRAHRPLNRERHVAAARRLARYAPGETVVIREVSA